MAEVDLQRGNAVEIKVCVGSSCHLRGAREVACELQRLIAGREDIKLTGTFCMGDCRGGVCAQVDGRRFSLRPGEEAAFFEHEVLTRLRRQDK